MMRIRNLSVATLSALAVALPGVALSDQHNDKDYTDIPEPEQADAGFNYVTGGVGDAQQIGMESRYNDYSFKMINVRSGPDSAYVSDVHVTITRDNGETVLETTTNGPWLFANLPAGSYDIRASFEGNTKMEEVTLNWGADQRLVVDWKT